jgi:hypothetical protein
MFDLDDFVVTRPVGKGPSDLGDEDLFFKIRISGLDRLENPAFYFNSPEDYEKHSRTLLDFSVKNDWYEKYQRRIEIKRSKS